MNVNIDANAKLFPAAWRLSFLQKQPNNILCSDPDFFRFRFLIKREYFREQKYTTPVVLLHMPGKPFPSGYLKDP